MLKSGGERAILVCHREYVSECVTIFYFFFNLGIDGDRWRVRDNCDMRIMVGCRYLHTGCQCNPQKSGSGDKTFLI